MTGHDPLAALRLPIVRAYALGRVFSVVGWQIVAVTVGWHLYERTGRALALGLVGLFELLPVLVLLLPAGHAADRFARRSVAMVAHGLLALGSVGLAIAAHREAPEETIYALLLVMGAGRGLAAPSVSTLLPQLLPPEVFANTNAWTSSIFELSTVIGPALGGWLIALSGGATVPFAVAAGCQVVFVLLLLRLPRVAPTGGAGARSLRDVFAGLGFVRRQPVFLAAMTLDLLAVLFGGAVALLPIYAKDVLHVGPKELGLLRAAPGVGALLMALLVTRIGPWKRPGRALLVTVTGFAVATIGFGLSTSLPLSLLFLFLTGATDSVSVVIRMTLEQMITPDALRGRVAAINFVFIGCSNELGAFESGVAAALLGPVVAVVGGGVAALLVVLGVARTWPELVRLGPLHTLRPAPAGAEAATAPPAPPG